MNPADSRPQLKDHHNVFYGYSREEISEMLHSEHDDPDQPRSKIKRPKYKKNKVSTSKYNYVNFLPKSILVQFLRFYNLYFLATVVLQGIPAISTYPVFLAALPFIFVIGMSVLRELIEEIKRRKQDK